MSEEKRSETQEYYEKMRRESGETLSATLPSIVLYVGAAVLIWLFGRLVFIPIAQGIDFYGYPMPQILNFIILVALAVVVLRVFVSMRRAVDAAAGYAACEIGAPQDVTPEEVGHYRTALRGIFYIVVVSLAFMLFMDYLAFIHPGLAGVVLLAIVVWAIYTIWRVVRAVSAEIQRYTVQLTKKTLG